jgi:DNA modification methylase
MDNFIFQPTNNVSSTNTEYYCLSGHEDFIDNNDAPRLKADTKLVLAKKIVKTGSPPQYYIKISNQNKLFNPLSGGLEDRAYSIVDNVCRPADKFRTVNQKVFDLYVRFLSSKNIAWLTKAEREII